MKLISLFFVIFLFSACNNFFTKDNGKGSKVDPAKGEEDFNPQKIKPISAEEVLKNAFKGDCAKYKNVASFSIFGDKLPIKALQNCLAKALDESTKEVCIEEANAKEAKKYYEKRGDDQAVREMEEHLAELEEIKHEVTEDIYSMADEVYNLCEDVRNEIDDAMEERANSIVERFLGRTGKFLVTSECKGFSRILDSRGRNPCRNFDFSKMRK